MKKLAVRMVIALVVCALSGSMVLAKDKIKNSTVTFGVDFVVGGTLVKKGTYKLSFNEKTNELTIFAQDKTVVAKTVARAESRKRVSSGMEIVLARKGENQALVSLAFPGGMQDIVVDTQAASAQK